MEDFTKKPEVLFIAYNDVIKCTGPFLIKQILKSYRKYYENYINLTLVENMDDKNLLTYYVTRNNKNFLESMAIKPFDFNKSYNELYNKFDDMYFNCDLLAIGRTIPFLMNQKFTSKIYIYSEEYDKRIHADIQMNYKDMNKVNYVTGPLHEVIKQIEGVTTYIFADIFDVTTLLAFDKCAYTNILVANYGYNYYYMEDGKLALRMNLEEVSKEKIFKFATFMPADFTNSHFSMFEK